jgi:hypothetical protein
MMTYNAARLAALELTAETKQAVALRLGDRVSDLLARRNRARGAAEAERAYASSGRVPAGWTPDPGIAAELAAAEAALAAAIAARDEAESEAGAAAQLHRACAKWAESFGHVARVEDDAPPLPAGGEPHRYSGMVTALRETIARLRAEQREVEAAPLPLAEAEARLDAALATVARSREPHVALLYSGAASLPSAQDLGLGANDIASLLAPLVREQLLARLREAHRTAGKPIAAKERGPRLAKLRASIHQAEEEEEAAVLAAEAAGLAIARRADADPAIVLQARAAEQPERGAWFGQPRLVPADGGPPGRVIAYAPGM